MKVSLRKVRLVAPIKRGRRSGAGRDFPLGEGREPKLETVGGDAERVQVVRETSAVEPIDVFDRQFREVEAAKILPVKPFRQNVGNRVSARVRPHNRRPLPPRRFGLGDPKALRRGKFGAGYAPGGQYRNANSTPPISSVLRSPAFRFASSSQANDVSASLGATAAVSCAATNVSAVERSAAGIASAAANAATPRTPRRLVILANEKRDVK